MAVPKVAAIVGFGPGLGEALARKLIAQGYVVGALCRKPPPAQRMLIPVACDATNGLSVKLSFDTLEKTGPVSVLVYNVASLVRGPFLQTQADAFEQAWRDSAYGAFHCAGRVLPNMLAARNGTIIFTGATASLRGGANFSAFASAKFALRGLSQALARELGPQGVHVAHVVIDGLIWSERTRERFDPKREACLEPEDVAESYWSLVAQPRSAWTHELDLRPHAEKY